MRFLTVILLALLATAAQAANPTIIQNLQVQTSLTVTPAPIFTACTGYLYGNAAGAASCATTVPISTGVGGLGTGVATALAASLNASGGLVGYSGALGTPTSGTLTNATGLPIATGVSGLGTGVATALAASLNATGGVPSVPVAAAQMASGAAVANIGSQGLTASLFNQGLGNQIWSNNGAFIYRFGDRSFIGGAEADDGTNSPTKTADWLATLLASWNSQALGATYSDYGMLKVLTNTSAASTTSLVTGCQTLNVGSQPCYGRVNIGVANNATYSGTVWGDYVEVHRVTGTGAISAEEFETTNHTANATTPSPNAQGIVRGFQMGCGGGFTGTTYTCGVALQSVANPATWNTILNVMAGSVTGSNPAIKLPAINGIEFVTSGNVTSDITATDTMVGMTQKFNASGIQWVNHDGSVNGYFNNSSSGATGNYWTLNSAISGGSPSLTATGGTDANVSLTLSPKGTGAVKINGEFYTYGTTPTMGACGTSPTISGTDVAGIVTVGTGTVTSCTINFSGTLQNVPHDVQLTPANAAAAAQGTTLAYVNAPTATGWSISGTALAGAAYAYHVE